LVKNQPRHLLILFLCLIAIFFPDFQRGRAPSRFAGLHRPGSSPSSAAPQALATPVAVLRRAPKL
jgi:hypothetical protein